MHNLKSSTMPLPVIVAFASKKVFIFFLCLVLLSCSVLAQNPIVTENQQTGTASAEWDINGSGDPGIQGFGTSISINTGGAIDFKIDVKAPATNFTIKIYRLGYYNGDGARFIADIGSIAGTAQPAPLYDASTGKTDCSNWSVSASWTATGAVSGIYIAKLTRTDNSGSSHIAFVVRNDGGNAAILFKTSDATWQAYNAYGGNSLYVNNSGTAVPGFNHATKVSYNRPFFTRAGGGGGGASEDWLFNSEYPMIRWMERNGYDVSYTTDVDMDMNSTPITPSVHKVLLSVGHDEYWSAAERSHFETARNNGVHLAFFSGNEVYWKTRWEDGNRTMVCYKEGTEGENICGGKCDPLPNVWTGLWRDGCAFPAADGCNPENSLSGQISWNGTTGSITVPSIYKDLRFWRNTSVPLMGTEQTISLTENTLGYEWDPQTENEKYPPGRILMSATTLSGKTHHLSLYRHSSGALVFGAGTVQWSWGLDENHDRGNEVASEDMQQATINLFADMSVLPGSIQPPLIASSPTDITAPVSIITSPLEGALLPNTVPLTITGTATDVSGVVAGVEVSVDGGITWNAANGTNNWSYLWTPNTIGTFSIHSRAFDDNGNMEIVGNVPAENAVSITVFEAPPVVCPCSVWPVTTIPAVITENDPAGIETGMKFKSSVTGYITGVKFFKGPQNIGVHTGNLWTTAGANLGSVVFSGESASGWQVAYFSAPVQIDADVSYIVSYYTPSGYYSADVDYFNTSSVISGPLTALENTLIEPNGVYKYGSTSTFPNDTYQSSNYWVDVVFENSVGADLTAPTVTSVAPPNNGNAININASVTGIFSESIAPATVSNATFELRNSSSTLVPATVSYNAATRTATLTPGAALTYSTVYTATLKGGSSDPMIKDLAGNALATNYQWSFTTKSPPPPPPSEGPGGPILVISDAANPFSRYPVEILRAEGLNEFLAADISTITAEILNDHDVVVLGQMSLSATHVSLLTDWVNLGGTLIALKPDPQLSTLLGINPVAGNLSDKYLLFNTSSGPGAGLVNQTIQFHGAADHYILNGATSLATLYSAASIATVYPAVTTYSVGANGGKAIAFTYDLARSIVYTRQGNPAYAGQSRDEQPGPIRSDNLFFPDYIDFNKIAIPQADEQQHLLTNIILQGNLHRKPLPRFWFLPRKLKAAVVMTGDDHAAGGTIGRFNQYLAFGNNSAQDVLDWKAIRGTSYIYSSTSTSTISDAQAAAFESQGFEIAAHITTNCGNWTSESQLDVTYFTPQLAEFANKWPSVPAPTTSRTHCIAWSDWASQAKVQASKGIRLDDNYYYWPDTWVLNRPGMFTGSGMPMRFADLDGSIIDCYQVATQLTDESGITYATHINSLLDKAIGSEGYYGVFCANMHTDVNGGNSTTGSDAIIASAQARQIPVISARQMLNWLDARNASSFSEIVWEDDIMSFSVTAAAGAHKLQAMVPVSTPTGQITGITFNSTPVTYTTEVIKGINYAFFEAGTGNYTVNYQADNTAPVISNVVATPNTNGTATITWTTGEAANSGIDYGTSTGNLSLNSSDAALVTSHSVTLSGLSFGTVYYFRVTAEDISGNSITEPVSPGTFSFTMPQVPCASDITIADFNTGTIGANTVVVMNESAAAVSLKPLVNEEFTGTVLPSGWTNSVWDGQAGALTTFSDGQLAVNGTHVSYNASVGPGTSLEFVATYTTGNFQNIGFTGDAAFNNPWVVIGRGNEGDNNVYARTSGGQSALLGTALLNAPHRYRIQWLSNASFAFYVDGSLIATPAINQTIGANTIVQVSDYPAGGASLSVDWIRFTPYSMAGTYISRVFDAGTTTNWGAASWTADFPGGTTLQLSQRQSDNAVDILTAAWTAIPSNGATIGGTSRYIQYKAELATSSNSVTPLLKNINIACNSDNINLIPVVTSDPLPQTKCSGLQVSFTSASSGSPAPVVQWQVSSDNGNSWSDILLATNSTYSFITSTADNGNRYRAIWTNLSGSDISAAAMLTVNALPTASIAALNNPICPGGNILLQLSGATGLPPYSLGVNGTTYNSITSGQTFATFSSAEQSIWGSSGSPVSPSVTDNQPIEVGTKFRSSLSGYITGIRFYKGITNTGTHTASLWSTGGTLLASVPFTSETASGWQEVRFQTPVAIQANTTYIASYFSASGYFAISANFFNSTGVTNGPLTALQSGTDGVNGVFKYGGGFPNGGSTANYWVDVLFKQTNNASADYSLTSITDANGCTNSGAPLSSITVTTSATPAGSITASTPTVNACSNINLTFNASAGTGPFSLTINGNNYPNISSAVPFTAGVVTYSPASSTIWSAGTVGGSQTVDNAATELGVKIKSSVPGTISGIRFYKDGTAILNFTASLWAVGNTTTPLATASYTSDNTAGWKQINFSTPVVINSNTTYIASYFSPASNYYAFTSNGLNAPVVNSPLTAEGSLYKQPGPGYPTSISSANYWVDVVFSSNSSISNFNLTQVTSAAGCIATGNPVSSTAVTVTATSGTATWLGINTDWTDPQNWCGGLPGTSSNITIPTGQPNMPVLNSDISITHLSLQDNATLDINGRTLTINGAVTGTGTLKGSASSGLIINGAAGIVRFTPGFQELKNCTLSSGATASLGTALKITAGTAVNNEGTLTVAGSGVLTTNGNLTIQSNLFGTARIAAGNSAGGYISGNVTVERYLPRNNNKGWRLLSAPTAGQTIRDAWQEGQANPNPNDNLNPGFGTVITAGGSQTMAQLLAAGLDAKTPGYSLLRYEETTDNLVGIANTNTTAISAQPGYYLFVRGDRSIRSGDLINITPTILRSTGTIYQGNQQPVTILQGKFALVRNPYASALDLRNIMLTGGASNSVFQIWDPKLAGSSGLGGIQNLTKTGSDYIINPGGGSYNEAGSVQNFIESGSAFFVQATGSDGGIGINETSKVAGSRNAFRPLDNPAGPSIFSNLYAVTTAGASLADGNLVLVNGDYSNEIDGADGKKNKNFSENFGMLRNGTGLAVEKRASIGMTDTIYYNMSGLKPSSYQMAIMANELSGTGLTGVLEDSYLNTITYATLDGTTSYDFTVTSAPASSASNRFRLTFRQLIIVPVSFISVTAEKHDTEVKVAWTVAGERGVLKYMVERSTDGRSFTTAGTITATGNANYDISYNWLDTNALSRTNFYRIKSIGINGELKYSSIVIIVSGTTRSAITISPNPVDGNTINLQFTNERKGRYVIRLLNATGQSIFTKNIEYVGGNSNQALILPKIITQGTYQLEINGPNKEKQTETLLITK